MPAIPWRRTWLGALGLVAVLFGVWEGLGRLSGFPPHVSDDVGLWALQRSRVPAHDRRALVLAGKSRILVGLDLAVVREVTGVTPQQLAISGASPVPVLRDLAADPSFRGRVICEFAEDDVLGLATAPSVERVTYYHGRAFSADVERRLRLFFETRLVFRSPDLSPRALAGSLARGRLPSPPAGTSRADRSMPIDFTRRDNARMRNESLERLVRRAASNPPPSPEQFLRAAADVDAVARAIHARGGRVILVRFPTSGRRWDFEESRFPKRLYWDVFAAGTSTRTVHFKDHPDLARHELPDWLHLDRRDAPGFTRALLQVLADDLR